jgi:hypothetical protein
MSVGRRHDRRFSLPSEARVRPSLAESTSENDGLALRADLAFDAIGSKAQFASEFKHRVVESPRLHVHRPSSAAAARDVPLHGGRRPMERPIRRASVAG